MQRRQAGTQWGSENIQTIVFPDMRREIGCLKLDVVVILEFFPSASSHPATASSQNSPSPGAGALGHLRARMEAGGGPLSPSTSGHLFLLGFEEGQVPSCPGGCRRMAVFRVDSPPGCGQEASCRGPCNPEHPALCSASWVSFSGPHHWQDERNECGLC